MPSSTPLRTPLPLPWQPHCCCESDNTLLWKRRYFTALERLWQITNPFVPGWLRDEEGLTLSRAAWAIPEDGAVLEIGAFCGRSTRYLFAGCLLSGSHLWVLDPFTTAFPGEPQHDPGMDWMFQGNTRPVFQANLAFNAGYSAGDLQRHMTVLQDRSLQVARSWRTALDIVWIDGNHSQCRQDVAAWVPHLKPHGLLCLHDVTLGDPYGIDGPTNTFLTLKATGWTVIHQVGGMACLSRDRAWWNVRYEALNEGIRANPQEAVCQKP